MKRSPGTVVSLIDTKVRELMAQKATVLLEDDIDGGEAA